MTRASCLLMLTAVLGLLVALLPFGAGESVEPVEVFLAATDAEHPAVTDLDLLPMKYRDCNLVLVSFDALQAAHVGCLGNERRTTPVLDAVASQGFNFADALSTASWTVPASMTWFTGVYPSEHGMTNKYAVYSSAEKRTATLKERSPDLATLAEILRNNGYATAGFTGNAGVSGGFGYDRGFDIYDHEAGRFGSMDRSIPESLQWLKKNRDRKFFLFLHGYDIHGQNTPTNGFDYRYVDRRYDRRYSGSEQEQEELREEGLEKGRLDLRDEDVRFWRAVYDEKINRTDQKFGLFLRAFARLGLAGRTVFVLTSDHGTELYEHRRFDHGFTLYQEQIHVPLIVRLPGQAVGKVVRDRVSSIDIMPTVLDLLDVEVPETTRKRLRGTSLVPAMRGGRTGRDVFAETDYREYTFKRCIVAPDGWKLIATMEDGSLELYDLSNDPKETRNLAAVHPERTAELKRRLFAHFKSIGHDLTSRPWRKGLNPVYPSQGREPSKN